MRRILKRILLGTLALVLVAVGFVLIALHTSWGRNLVREKIEAQLAQTFVGGARIGRLDGSAFTTLVAHDVIINGPDGTPAVTVKTLELELALLPLVHHHAKLRQIVADDVEVLGKRNAQGELELTHLLKPNPPTTWDVDLQSLAIRRAHVMLDGAERVDLDDVTIFASATVPHGGTVDATAVIRGQWRQRGSKLDVVATVHANDREVTVPGLLARVDGVSVAAHGVRIDRTANPPAIGGVAFVSAPRADVEHLSGVRIPDDVSLAIVAVPRSPWTHVELHGAIGATDVTASVELDAIAKRAIGTLASAGVDLKTLTGGRQTGVAHGGVIFDVNPLRAMAIVHVAGELDDLPAGTAVATVVIENRAAAGGVASAVGVGQDVAVSVAAMATSEFAFASVTAELRRMGELITLEHGTLTAETRDPARATGGKAPVHGHLSAHLALRGALAPIPALAVEGVIDGQRLRARDLRVAKLHLAIDAHNLPSRPMGSLELRAVDLVRGETQLGELDVDAANRDDGKLAVTVRSRPKFAPFLIDADALVTLGGAVAPSRVPTTIGIDIAQHRVRANGIDWRGTGGHVAITPARIELRDLTSTSEKGSIAVSGELDRRSGDIAAHLGVKGSMASLNPSYLGDVDATLDVTRKRGRWGGSAIVDATGLALDPDTLKIDAKATLALNDRRLELAADVATHGSGSARLVVAVETPANITDVAAWQRIERSAIDRGILTLHDVDLAPLARLAHRQDVTGHVDADLRFSGAQVGGSLNVRDVMIPALRGTAGVSASLRIVQNGPLELTPTLVTRVGGVGTIQGSARVSIPEHPFDPAAWRQLDLTMLHEATVRVDEMAIDPGLLARFGIATELKGRASVVASLGEGARTGTLAIDVKQLRGGQIVEPLDVHFDMSLHGTVTRTALKVSTGKTTLLTGTGELAITLGELVKDPLQLVTVPLRFDLAMPAVSAPRLLAVFGRGEVTGGALRGTIALGGTMKALTVKADLVGERLAIPPGIGNTPVKILDRITVAATWDPTAGASIKVDGKEHDGGTLQLAAAGHPARLAEATVTLKAKKFDLSLVLPFAPGPAGGASGRLDADLTMTGLDPATAKFAGHLHLAGARIPLTPQVGTLRSADIDLQLSSTKLDIKVDGKLGPGTVKIAGSASLTENALVGGDATITLHSVSPIATVQPKIDADITAKVRRAGSRWNAEIVVLRGKVVVPEDRGEPLDPVGAPADMVFVNGSLKPPKKAVATNRPPEDPMLVATITVRPIFVESTELRGELQGRLVVSAARGQVGVVGNIEAVRGDLDLFGRRYQVDRAAVHFDGSTDPVLDVRILHDFPDVTVITEVRGRLSKPELSLTSDPSLYSQGQLLGFLLGGEPGGDPSAVNARDAATSAGASVIAGKLGGYVKKALPIDLDVLRYETATAATSAAVTVGRWLTRSLFIAYRQRFSSRPDENSNEGEIEYWLTRKIVVDGVAGDRGVSGLDLLWRHRY